MTSHTTHTTAIKCREIWKQSQKTGELSLNRDILGTVNDKQHILKRTNGFVEGLDILVQSTHQLITDIPRVKIQDSLYFELKEVNKWSM